MVLTVLTRMAREGFQKEVGKSQPWGCLGKNICVLDSIQELLSQCWLWLLLLLYPALGIVPQ